MLPDYWSGHHLAHIQVPVDRTTTITQLRAALHSELNEGAVAGSDRRTLDDSGPDGDAWYKAAHAAIDRDVRLKHPRTTLRPFRDLEAQLDDDDYSVYAFFVFVDLNPNAPQP
jgi:hypothetical protein